MRILLDGDSLTLNEVVAVARQAAEVQMQASGEGDKHSGGQQHQTQRDEESAQRHNSSMRLT